MMFDEPFGGVLPGATGAVLSTLMRTGTPLTGRKVHSLLSDRHSLWTIQESLKTLAHLGLINTETVGRAGVHTVNNDHYAIEPLRQLLDPMRALTEVVLQSGGKEIQAVVLFGSIARGESTLTSDVDLAVIAPTGWDRRSDVQEAVRTRLGNDCDVLAFTSAEFDRLRRAGEPVVSDILSDGVALIGLIPGAA